MPFFALQIIFCHKQGTWSPSLRNSTHSKVRVSGAAISLIVARFCFGDYGSVRKHLACSLCIIFYQSSSSFFLALKSHQIPFLLYSGVFNTFRLCGYVYQQKGSTVMLHHGVLCCILHSLHSSIVALGAGVVEEARNGVGYDGGSETPPATVRDATHPAFTLPPLISVFIWRASMSY